MLVYIRSIREGDFELYIESMTKLMPQMFALDHTNYARWLSIHIRDMVNLSSKHPEVLAEFKEGKFVVHKTEKSFSATALDQCHEQNNAVVKGTGGAVGLTGDPHALRRWMVTGLEIFRITTNFEDQVLKILKTVDNQHHKQQSSSQKTFVKDVESLIGVIDEMGNLFLEESNDLLVLDTKDIVESIGLQQYKTFVNEKCVIPVSETISKNKLALFSRPQVKTPSKEKLQFYKTTVPTHNGNRLKLSIKLYSRYGWKTWIPEHLLLCYFFTLSKGCDATSSFLGRGKNRFGTLEKPCQMLLLHVARTEPDISGRSMALLERFVVLIYDLRSEAQQS